jgi:hypothetical protein
LLLAWSAVSEPTAAAERVANGGFEEGLNRWMRNGDVHLQTNRPVHGGASAIIGQGAGSLRQRVETGSGNDFTVSATIQSQRTKPS